MCCPYYCKTCDEYIKDKCDACESQRALAGDKCVCIDGLYDNGYATCEVISNCQSIINFKMSIY